jgi:hypothetical protein
VPRNDGNVIAIFRQMHRGDLMAHDRIMIFMSQSGLTDSAREHEWDQWYIRHLDIMATVPRVGSTQRFKTSAPGHPPSLAMYSVASEQVFSDPYYLSVRGMGEWLALIDRRFYRRNLFAGLDRAPNVSEEHVLLIADRPVPDPALAGLRWTWLECVGIDRSTPYRGMAVVDRAIAKHLDDAHDIAVYRPVTICREAAG